MLPQSVLVVEDDPDIREAVEMCLRDEGYRVFVADSGEAALGVLRTGQSPSLILLDVMMPRMDGYELLEALRADPVWAAIPVVVVSAYPAVRKARFGPPVATVLFKPFTIEDLSAAVRGVIAREGSAVR